MSNTPTLVGDSFTFSRQEPHRYGNPGEVEAVVITPTFQAACP